MIRAVIIDDEPLAQNHLRRMLESESDLTVVGESANVADGIAAVQNKAPDLLFLDIQLRNASGFDVLAGLEPASRPLVIFVTAYEEFAVRAFEEYAHDYILKPFDRARLKIAVDRARDRLASRGSFDSRLSALLEEMKNVRAAGSVEHLLARTDGRTLFIRLSEIEWVDASHNYVVLHVGSRSHRIRESITALHERLDPARFVRIHRSTIVNVDFVLEMQPWFGGDSVLVMKGGQRLRVGRNYRGVWRRWLKD